MTEADLAGVRHPAVRAARRLRRRRHRIAEERLLVEGPHAVAEALDHLVEVFATPDPTVPVERALDRCRAVGVPVTTVTDRALAALADARHPQGVVGVARWQRRTLGDLHDPTLLLVLDRVADPGNLGTVVRTADAAGADAVVLLRGSVDPTNGKVVRASAGSLFHLPVVDDVTPEGLAGYARAVGIRLVAADARAARRYHDVPCDIPIAIVFGSEAHGLSPQVQRHVETSVSVPISRPQRPGYRGHAESLNLATTTAVIAFEIARRRGAPDPPQE